LYGPKFAVQSQFAHDHILIQRWGYRLAGGSKYAQSNRKVVSRPLLAEVRRSKVNNRLLPGHEVAKTFQGGFHPMLAFLDGTVRQAAHVEAKPLFYRNLYGNCSCIDAVDCTPERLSQHGPECYCDLGDSGEGR